MEADSSLQEQFSVSESQIRWEGGPNEKLLLKYCLEGNLEGVKRLLALTGEERVGTHCQDPELRTPLHLAAKGGHTEIVRALLEDGAAWNTVDSEGKTAGELAQEGNHQGLYDELLNAGIRTELLLGLLAQKPQQEGEEGEDSESCNKDYLKQKLVYVDNKLLDAEGNGVMMGWEDPLMRLHAQHICVENPQGECKGTGDVLNVGFGLGIIDTYIQTYKPRSHTIIEAHPDVYQHMLDLGWDKKPGVKIVFGRWQEVIHELGFFDGIFFDTYGEFYDQLKEFHEYLGDHLKPGGTYSYFNGLAATNPFFHQVYCEIARLHLSEEIGIDTKFITVPMKTDEVTWQGVTRKYWTLDTYLLPICTWK